MSNHPTALILWEFYGTLLKELVIGVVIFALVRWRSRRTPTEPSKFPPEPLLGRQILNWGFGGLWILAGLLQAQPSMSTEFVPHYLVPNLNGQPFWLFNVMESGIVIWAQHPIFWDSLAVWLQFGMGIAMIWGPTPRLRRFTLGIATLWSLWVWVMGEGMGGLFVPGENSWLAGAPGSSLFYGCAALMLLIPPERFGAPRVRRWIARGFTGLWGFLAAIEIWPPDGYWTGRLLSRATLNMAKMPQPHWISSSVYATARVLAAHPQFINGLIALVLVLLALGWGFWPGRVVAWVTAVWILLTWALCQDFGVLGGLATDPNSGLPALIFVGAFLSLSRADRGGQALRAFGRKGHFPRFVPDHQD